MNRAPIIAIVDDDEGVRLSMSSLARSLGYQVRTYASALDFLREVTIGEPDCLVTDLQMPGMGGEALRDALVTAKRNVPVIFMTAFPSPSSRALLMSNGASAYLVKPVDGATMARCLAQALARGRA